MNKIIFPIIVIVAMVGATIFLIQIRPTPSAQEIKKKIPYVEIVEASKVPLRSFVRTYGTVRPRTSTTLIAEVPGIIKEVAPFSKSNEGSATFRAGGFFRKNELLLKIEDIDLRTFEAQARANLRRSELLLVQEQELAKQARIEWGDRDWVKASHLVKRIPQIQKAEAEKKAAEARLVQASLDLDRCGVRAPFEGRILETMADVGQQVGAGSSAALAQIYALDAAEVDFALSRSQISFLGFDDGIQKDLKSKVDAQVLDENGKIIHSGSLDRSEGVVDPRTRLTNMVVQIEHCFANPFLANSPINPLSVGQFVELVLLGQEVRAYVIPESAFRTEDEILVVEKENRIVPRKVSVIHRSSKEVWVENGLSDGDRVCITPIEIVAKGMQVRIANRKVESNQTGP